MVFKEVALLHMDLYCNASKLPIASLAFGFYDIVSFTTFSDMQVSYLFQTTYLATVNLAAVKIKPLAPSKTWHPKFREPSFFALSNKCTKFVISLNVLL